ncbi:MAG: FliO/MopB family protein [Bryobacteraceae bacterium]|nr:FliO/MopB family protein [Bryobacteraceae bacterium]
MAAEAISLVVVFLLLGAAMWLHRRRPDWPKAAGSRNLESLDRVRLGPNHTVHLIRAGNRRLIVATHPGGCTLLGRLRSEDASGLEPVRIERTLR